MLRCSSLCSLMSKHMCELSWHDGGWSVVVGGAHHGRLMTTGSSLLSPAGGGEDNPSVFDSHHQHHKIPGGTEKKHGPVLTQS